MTAAEMTPLETTDRAAARPARRTALAAGVVALTGMLFTAAPGAEAKTITAKVSRPSVVKTAKKGIGVKYRSGGTTRKGWDCSGFTKWCYKQHGVTLPRTAAAQGKAGRRISKKKAVPGDLVYYPGRHVGIYAGGNKMIDAGNRRVNTSKRKIYGKPQFVRIGR